MLKCTKCSHDNDLGRIFCAKCGEKLEISKVVPPGRVKRMASKGKEIIPLGKAISFFVWKVAKVIMLAAIAAFITLIAWPSDFQNREWSTSDLEAFQAKHEKLEGAINNQQEIKIVFDESDLNAALAQAIKDGLKQAGSSNGPQLENIDLSLRDGNIMVTLLEKWKWFRLTVQIQTRLDHVNAQWHFRAEQMWMGLFPMPSWLPSQAKNVISDTFKHMWKGFELESQWLEQLQSAEIKPGQLILTTKK